MATTNKWSKAFFVDLGERVGATFLGALLTVFTATETTPLDWTDGQAVWTLLGVPVLFALIKGLLANIKDPESGASFVNAPPGPVLVDEAGVSSILGALGIGLLVLGVILLFTTLLKVFVVAWAVIIAAIVIGIVLLYLDGRRL